MRHGRWADRSGEGFRCGTNRRKTNRCETFLQKRHRFGNEQPGAPAWHKNARIHGYPESAKLSPAEDVFQGFTGNAAIQPFGQFKGAGGLGQEQPGLIFGENAAGCPQRRDNMGKCEGIRK